MTDHQAHRPSSRQDRIAGLLRTCASAQSRICTSVRRRCDLRAARPGRRGTCGRAVTGARSRARASALLRFSTPMRLRIRSCARVRRCASALPLMTVAGRGTAGSSGEARS